MILFETLLLTNYVRKKLPDHKAYIQMHGEDIPEILKLEMKISLIC